MRGVRVLQDHVDFYRIYATMLHNRHTGILLLLQLVILLDNVSISKFHPLGHSH
jgi:hypothetical protein